MFSTVGQGNKKRPFWGLSPFVLQGENVPLRDRRSFFSLKLFLCFAFMSPDQTPSLLLLLLLLLPLPLLEYFYFSVGTGWSTL